MEAAVGPRNALGTPHLRLAGPSRLRGIRGTSAGRPRQRDQRRRTRTLRFLRRQHRLLTRFAAAMPRNTTPQIRGFAATRATSTFIPAGSRRYRPHRAVDRHNNSGMLCRHRRRPATTVSNKTACISDAANRRARRCRSSTYNNNNNNSSNRVSSSSRRRNSGRSSNRQSIRTSCRML